MTNLILLIVAGFIFFLFFRQILSGDYPKRGVDYGKGVVENGIDEIKQKRDRLDELIKIAEQSIDRGNFEEAKKALNSALIISPDNSEALRRLGVVHMKKEEYQEAKRVYQSLINLDSNDDLAHSSLANALHKLGDDDEAITHHKVSIDLDKSYAPHYYNYANTLYDLERYDEAENLYKKAYELDSTLKEAEEMIKEIKKLRSSR